MTASEIESKIDREIPLGSSWLEVESWLKREGIWHHYIGRQDYDKPVGMSGRVFKAGPRWTFIYTAIDIEFYFNDNDILIERFVSSDPY
jgi:hypothetical protein